MVRRRGPGCGDAWGGLGRRSEVRVYLPRGSKMNRMFGYSCGMAGHLTTGGSALLGAVRYVGLC